LELTLDEGKLIDCFEKSIIGMTEGEQKSVHFQPEQAMEERRPELVSQVPLHSIPVNLSNFYEITLQQELNAIPLPNLLNYAIKLIC